jgi:hypothetical protein
MSSWTHSVQANEMAHFSTTRTLSDFPLLIGEMLRRGNLRITPPAVKCVLGYGRTTESTLLRCDSNVGRLLCLLLPPGHRCVLFRPIAGMHGLPRLSVFT